MTAVKILWGPAAIGPANITSSALSSTNLSDADNAAAWSFCVPADGTIEAIGFLVTAENGTSPAYNTGIVTVDTSGNPTTSAYGGSAITEAQWTSTGWKWVTLSTGATANAGDWAAVHIYPSGSTPDGSNYAAVAHGGVADGGINHTYLTSWTPAQYGAPMAIKYATTGAIYGFALTSTTTYVAINSGTTPDEAGMLFQVPAAMTCTGARFGADTLGWGSAATADVVLYSAADAVLASATISDKDLADPSDYVNVFWDGVALSAATNYRLVVKPTTSTNGNVTVPKWSVESAAARAMWPEGASWQWTERTNAGAWTDTDTAIGYMGLWVSDITFAAAGGGEYAYIG